MGPGFLPTFLYYFVSTTFIVVLVVSKGMETGTAVLNPYPIGLGFGLVSGLMGAYFNRYVTVSIPFSPETVCMASVQETLTQMGFAAASQLEDMTVYERPGLSKFFSGKIFIQAEMNSVTISGRSSNVTVLRKTLQA